MNEQRLIIDEVSIGGQGEYVALGSGGRRHRYHAIWLRDNALDEETRSVVNGQRLLTLQGIPVNTLIQSAVLRDTSLEVRFVPGNKVVVYPIEWLIRHSYDHQHVRESGWTDPSIQLWQQGSMPPPVATYNEVTTSDIALRGWLAQIARYGFALLRDGPQQEQALYDVVKLFGYVRETNYGRHFDVRTEVNPTNLAFTGLALQGHTDNPYRDPVPTLQVLYCLQSSAAGGENMVIDGFAVARRLHEENAAWFHVLSKHCARFEYTVENKVRLTAKRPMIELSADGELIAVRFNNRSAAPLTDVPFDEMALYYEAYRRMSEIVDEESMAVSFRLQPGDCFVVDNTRVLHARKAYDGVGNRWLQGCYADKDSLLSTLAVLEQAQPEHADV